MPAKVFRFPAMTTENRFKGKRSRIAVAAMRDLFGSDPRVQRIIIGE